MTRRQIASREHKRVFGQTRLMVLLTLLVLGTSSLFAQGPAIYQHGVMNRASQVPPDFPGGALAPGAMIQIRGTDLGPSQTVFSEGFPLRTEMGPLGTRVLVNEDGQCPLFSIEESLINCQLPSDLTGAQVRLRVITSVGQSNTITVPLAQGNFGLFTRSGTGLGPGSCQVFTGDPDPFFAYQFVGPDTPARQGQTMTCYGTGFGPTDPPVPAGQAAAGPAPAQNQVGLFVGERPAQVQYAGRAPGFAGLDQLQFTVPEDAPDGCAVPLRVQIGNQIGNVATIAVNRTGLPCQDPVETPMAGRSVGSVVVAGGLGNLGPGQLGSGSGPGGPHMAMGSGPGGVGPGGIGPRGLHPGIPPHAGGVGLGANRSMGTDVAPARFMRLGATGGPSVGIPPVGSCQLYTQAAGEGSADLFTGPVQYLNAGNLDIECSGTHQRLGPDTVGGGGYLYAASLEQPLGSQTCTLSGSGGPDVGAFGPVTLDVPGPITITTNLPFGARVNRQNAFQLNWSGGGADEIVMIHGRAFLGDLPPDGDPTQLRSRAFVCSAPAGAGNFTVPEWVMNGLPAGPFSLNMTHMPNASGVARFGSAGLAQGGMFRWMFTTAFLDLVLE